MATLYLDYEGGNDANDGLSFANRVKTITSGLTAARIAPGDTIRVMGSPAPTLIDNSGVWTNAPNSSGTGVSVGTMTAATNASPIVVTRNTHGLNNGDIVRITGAVGNTAANGVWEVANVTTNTFELKGSAGNGTWSSGGAITNITHQIVKIPAVLVKNVDNCETAWTAANGAASALATTSFKEFLSAEQITMPGSPATGTLYAYRQLTGGAQDFSAYQQITFWIQVSATTATGNLKLCLCSDTAGAVIVDTFAIPAIGSAVRFVPITIDKGSALGASIQSVALYSDTVAPAGSLIIRLDNIMACKASSSNDAVTLTSLIGKKSALRQSIVSSTYATPIVMTVTGHGFGNGDSVYIQDHATNTNANGVFRIANVTANTFELVDVVTQDNVAGNGVGGATGTVVSQEGWWAIQSIYVNSTTTMIMLETADPGSNGYTTRGYAGRSETIATYKRETIKWTMVASGVSNSTLQDSGSQGNPITMTGGWDRTNMSTQDSDTWWDFQSGFGNAITFSAKSWWVFDRLHLVRTQTAWTPPPASALKYACVIGSNGVGITYPPWDMVVDFYVHVGGSSGGNSIVHQNCQRALTRFAASYSHLSSSPYSLNASFSVIHRAVGKNNGLRCFGDGGIGVIVYSGQTENHPSAVANINSTTTCRLILCRVDHSEANVSNFSSGLSREDGEIRYYMRNNDPTLHGIYGNNRSFVSESSVRHTASGLAWKISVTSTIYDATAPVRYLVATVPCNANQTTTVKAWLRRTNTGLTLQLVCPGKQIKGVPNDLSASMTAIADTWEEVTLSITPTESGMVDIYLSAYGGTTYSGYIDDMTITVGGTAPSFPTMDWAYLGAPFVVFAGSGGGGGLMLPAGMRGGFA